jgi:hypothetical protein
MPYLKSTVADLKFPHFINYLTPIVEFSFETDVADFDGRQRTIGTISPGVIYNNEKYQLSLESIIPVNRQSGEGVGVIAAFHLHLDEVFPDSLGKPLIGARRTDD